MCLSLSLGASAAESHSTQIQKSGEAKGNVSFSTYHHETPGGGEWWWGINLIGWASSDDQHHSLEHGASARGSFYVGSGWKSSGTSGEAKGNVSSFTHYHETPGGGEWGRASILWIGLHLMISVII